jgi:hypothetical protein
MIDSNSQPGRDHFGFRSYASKPRWNSYWHQLDEALELGPSSCLVIGGGDAVIPQVLRSGGVDVTVSDVVEELKPDVTADVRDLPFGDREFDVVLCCQVLEHIPYETVYTALSELARVASQRVVISVPDRSRTVAINGQIGRRWSLYRRVTIAQRDNFEFNGVHYWELGSRNYTTRDFTDVVKRCFSIERAYRVQENPYHHFFVLSPS